jgi:hypothetical protein
MTFTPGMIIEKYLELRDYIKASDAAHDAEMAPYKASLKALENAALQIMVRDQVTQLKDKDKGTAFQKTQTYVKLADRASILDFARQTEGGMDIFTNAISKDYVVSYTEAHGAPPPGVEITREIVVQFRKA